MSKPDNEITANSTVGRVLVALRAGPMSSGELMERFGSLPSMTGLRHKGLVAEDDNGWRLTDAGRAACPLRNPLAGKVAKAPAAQFARLAIPALSQQGTPPPHRPAAPEPTGDTPMRLPATTDKPHVDQIRQLLINAPQGIARKDLIKRTGLPDSAVDNAIINLIKNGEAERKSYGVIAPIAASIKTPAPAIETPAALVPAPATADPAAVVPPPPSLELPHALAAADPDTATPEIDFSIHADGRLTIIDGYESMVLPPEATRRLGYFLGCLEMNTWPPRLDPEALHPQPTV